ncbi:MAG: DUF4982 domain-containing protein [Cyclobacteriaceae bacterium]|nr:DUF4982 domain-containing protein [Cyclobacteriaceae bacterium]
MHRENLINHDWHFHRGGALGAESKDYNDESWRRLDLPHDWSIEDIPGTNSPFDSLAISQVNGGFTHGGTAWYRKHLMVPAELKGNKFILQFDGVYMNAHVWVNGKFVGKHPYGYSTFWFDLTQFCIPGEDNVIAVKVMNEGENSRWYSGSGIYRNVWLKVLNPIHIAQWGVQISTPVVSASEAIVEIKTNVTNDTNENDDCVLSTKIYDNAKREVGSSKIAMNINSNHSSLHQQRITIDKPALWSTANPNLYTAVSEILKNDKVIDQTETSFGIRSISYDTEHGFRLNGEVLLMKGGCIHHDNGPLGAKAYDRAEERKIELLKASGYNAVRSAHNPPSTALLNACDKLGMLVINEAFDMWSEAKNPHDYHLYFEDWWKKDIENMVLRDFNHPSVIMWSTGNEIPERGKPKGAEISKNLSDYVKSLDNTRPVTAAVNGLSPDKDPYFATLDLAGYNYPVGGDHNKTSIYEIDHQRVNDRIMYCSESYPLEAFGSWMSVLDLPYVFGDFVWTAFDYLGEASIGWRGYMQKNDFYPWNIAWCGDLDICGWKRPQSYYRDVLWKENQISIFVAPPTPTFPENPERESWSKWHWHDVVADWNWQGHEGKIMEVIVYSSCEVVELFQNGKSMGKKNNNRSNEFKTTWSVPYSSGELKAIGYKGRKKASQSSLTTATIPEKIAMSADRNIITANGKDLSYVTVELIDKNGVRHPKAENLISFEIEGPGEIISIANANPVSTESYMQPMRKTWQGRAMVIIKSGQSDGVIRLKAHSEGLEAATIEISISKPSE